MSCPNQRGAKDNGFFLACLEVIFWLLNKKITNKKPCTLISPFFLTYRCLACLIWFYGEEMFGLYTRTPTCTTNQTEFLKVQEYIQFKEEYKNKVIL